MILDPPLCGQPLSDNLIPPDALMTSPVTQADSSDARKTTTGAISAGVPRRPSGVDAINFFLSSALSYSLDPPPLIVCPVIHRATSDARTANTSPRSSGSPMRLCAWIDSVICRPDTAVCVKFDMSTACKFANLGGKGMRAVACGEIRGNGLGTPAGGADIRNAVFGIFAATSVVKSNTAPRLRPPAKWRPPGLPTQCARGQGRSCS